VRSVFNDEKKLSIAALSQTLPDRLGIVSDFDDCSRDFFSGFSKLLDPLLRDSVARKVDSTSVWLRQMNQLHHGGLVVHEQGEQNNNRKRNSK